MQKTIPWFVLLILLVGCAAPAETSRSLTLEDVRPVATNLFNKYADKDPQALEVGPCLGVIEEQWAVDIAHNPRTQADNDPSNQCEAYRTGQAKHLIEFNPQGQIITIK